MKKTEYQYGVMSSKFSLLAENKLTAYATMVLHYHKSPHLIAIYSPEESKADMWLSFDGKCSKRLDEIFGGKDAFDKYVDSNVEDIKKCYNSIKRIV